VTIIEIVSSKIRKLRIYRILIAVILHYSVRISGIERRQKRRTAENCVATSDVGKSKDFLLRGKIIVELLFGMNIILIIFLVLFT